MYKFLERYKPSSSVMKNNLNSPESVKEVKFIVKIFLRKQKKNKKDLPGPDNFIGDFYQMFKLEII